MTSPVLLVLGAGPGIGKHVAQAFAAKGYRVALASRTDSGVDEGHIHITADFSNPEQVASVFETVQLRFNTAPSVVVYNGRLTKHLTIRYAGRLKATAYMRLTDKISDPLASYSLSMYHKTFATNNTSVILAMQQAVLGFRTLPASASKTFIMTGNILNLVTHPEVVTFGMSKTATSYAIRNLVEHETYTKEGIKYVLPEMSS